MNATHRKVSYLRELTFVVPPECQGQMIEWAYAIGDDEIVIRRTDSSLVTADRVRYSVVDLNDCTGPIEPWNAEPDYDDSDRRPVIRAKG